MADFDLKAAVTHAARLSEVEFAENPNSRCPCVLVLDTSGSMVGQPIEALNKALEDFRADIQKDHLAAQRVEVAVVTFDTSVQIRQDFVTVDQFEPPQLNASGTTAMGTAINVALNLVRDRKQAYRTSGISYYRPWIFLLTDGRPEGEAKEVFDQAAERARTAEKNGEATIFPVGVRGADMSALARISTKAPVLLNGLNFSEMFVWLSRSMQKVSQSKTGDQIALPPLGWGSVQA